MSALAAVVARRLRRPKKPAAAPKTETELAAERIAALYERMERILARHGHGRPATTTPLKHATSMVASGMNAKVLELTETYLAVRFGDRPLDARVTEEFQRGTTVLEASIKAQKAAQRG
jgi:hypothetical protein